MGSDRARISYDERQQYRTVVMQQGRVTLEADWNESQYIAEEELRKEALDIVGPAGTPDNGYAVSFSPSLPPFDFQVGAGTMYVGGMRVSLTSAVQYSKQSDWLDNSGDPDWSPLPQQPPGLEYIYLLLREQEVSAVEDNDLRDVALGGPDSAQRTRLIQHIIRLNTAATDCAGALAAAANIWALEGLAFDPATMRLKSNAALQVGFVNSGGAPTPCDPTAQGGYLGADNQLIRVQISSVQKARTGGMVTRFVWGFDDASFLYRVDVLDPSTLRLQSVPVDAEHQPQSGQTVEILMAAAELGNGEYVAAPRGFVTPLAGAYNPDTQTVTLQSPLPSFYGDGNPDHPHPPRVFLRVWQQELTFISGTPVVLGDTGIQVTLSTPNNAPFHIGDYWMFAVRPSTPQAVYPERYLTDAQPADGPREWVCPLAVTQSSANGNAVLADCRNVFDNLVSLTGRKLGGCCTINIKPADLKGDVTLQTIVDRFRGSAGVNICLGPGTYELTKTLQLTADHSNFTFEACAGGVTLRAAKGSKDAFSQGLVVMNAASSVTFRGITFQPALSLFGSINAPSAGTPQAIKIFISVCLRPASCRGLTVDGCRFVLPIPGLPDGIVAVGILAAGSCSGHRITRNRFEVSDAPILSFQAFSAGLTTNNFLAGYLLFPTTVSKNIPPTKVVTSGSAQLVTSSLQDATFRDNFFSGLTLSMYAYADCGEAEFVSNTIRNCAEGYCFLALPALALINDLPSVNVPSTSLSAASGLQTAFIVAVGQNATQLAGAVLRGFPLPDGFDMSSAITVTLAAAGLGKESTLLQSVFDRALPVLSRPPEGPGVPAPTIVKLGESPVLRGRAAPAALEGQFDINVLNQSYSIFEKLAYTNATPTVTPVSLHFSACDCNVVVPGASGLALLILDLAKSAKNAVTVNGNALASSNNIAPVALIFALARCGFNGNMVTNEADRTTGAAPASSLWTFLLGFANAITGNVFFGPAILPARNLSPAPPPPMDTWHFLNSES